MCAEQQGNFQQVAFYIAFEDFHGFHNFQRIADIHAKRLIHAADDGGDLSAYMLSHFYHNMCQCFGVFLCFHESAAAAFYVQHDAVRTSSNLFGHDAGSNERNAVYSACHIPQGIEFFVRRGQVVRLAHEYQMAGFAVSQRIFFRYAYLKTGNGFQFVNGAAGEAQTTTTHFYHRYTKRSYQRCQNQRCGVAYTAGAVFIHFETGQTAQIEQCAGVCHFHGHLCRFFRIHAVEQNCHQQSGNLIIRQGAVCDALNKERNFFFRQLLFITFFDDNILKIHIIPPFDGGAIKCLYHWNPKRGCQYILIIP